MTVFPIKTKRFLHAICLAVFLLSLNVVKAQEYRKHQVQAGETVYSISERYDVSKEELLKLNPDAVDGINAGDLLIIPAFESIKESAFFEHEVQPKETLYGLSKKFNVSIDDLLEYNPELMHGLQIGTVIKVPKQSVAVENTSNNEPKPEKGYQIITVKHQETVYSLSHHYGIDENEFYRLNPIVKESGLKEGQKVKVPLLLVNQTVKDTLPQEVITADEKPKEKEQKFELYKVKPNDKLSSIAFERGVKESEILALNPELKDGLQPGKFIILPVVKKEVVKIDYENSWLTSELPSNKLRITLVLPFYLSINDSIEMTSALGVKSPVYKRSKVALEFYNGFIIALDTLSALGIDVNLQVLDSDNSIAKMQGYIERIKAFEPDFIVGPLYAKNVEWLANELGEIPIISPLSKAANNTEIPNLVNCHSNFVSEVLEMAKVLNTKFLNYHIVFVNPDNAVNRERVNTIKQNLLSVDTPSIDEFWIGGEFPKVSEYEFRKSETKPTIWVLNNEDPVFLNDFLTKVYKIKDTNMVILGSSKVLEIKTIENRYLSELNYWGFSKEYADYTNEETILFINKFKAITNTFPSKYAFKGYDVGLYFSVITLLNDMLPIYAQWQDYKGLQSGSSYTKEIGEGPTNNHVYLLEIVDYKLVPVILN